MHGIVEIFVEAELGGLGDGHSGGISGAGADECDDVGEIVKSSGGGRRTVIAVVILLLVLLGLAKIFGFWPFGPFFDGSGEMSSVWK